MVLEEVQFVPTSDDAIHGSSLETIKNFKYRAYSAFLPPRDKSELVVNIEIRLFIEQCNLSMYFLVISITKHEGKWGWKILNKKKLVASQDIITEHLKKLGYEVHKITLLEND